MGWIVILFVFMNTENIGDSTLRRYLGNEMPGKGSKTLYQVVKNLCTQNSTKVHFAFPKGRLILLKCIAAFTNFRRSSTKFLA